MREPGFAYVPLSQTWKGMGTVGIAGLWVLGDCWDTMVAVFSHGMPLLHKGTRESRRIGTKGHATRDLCRRKPSEIWGIMQCQWIPVPHSQLSLWGLSREWGLRLSSQWHQRGQRGCHGMTRSPFLKAANLRLENWGPPSARWQTGTPRSWKISLEMESWSKLRRKLLIKRQQANQEVGRHIPQFIFPKTLTKWSCVFLFWHQQLLLLIRQEVLAWITGTGGICDVYFDAWQKKNGHVTWRSER